MQQLWVRPAPNGWYDPSDGSIHIDLKAGNSGQGLTLYTMAHELTHFIEQWSQDKYKVLADFLIKNYEKGRSVDDLVHLKQEALSQGRDKPVSYDEAYSEVIADSMEAMLSDGNVLEKLAELKQQDEGLVRKMKAFFDSFVKKIRSIYADLKPESAEGQLVQEMKDQFEQLQQLFAEALADAGENFRAAEVQKNTTRKGGTVDHDGRQFAERQQYNPIRETFAKERLDQLSNQLGDLFPLSANFETAILSDKTPVSNMTVVANSQRRSAGDSFYKAAKDAFKAIYGAKTTFAIKQLNINATADAEFARESISKLRKSKEMQTILDLTPEFRRLIENSRLLAVERTLHNDNKKTSLLCYRLYNAYIREEAYIDSNGKRQTRSVPHIVVFNVIQNLNDAKAHMVTDINDVAIYNGHNSSKLKYAAQANGNIIINSISEVYDIVKKIDRNKGGLRYSADDDLKYRFAYTERNDGVTYQDRVSAPITNRALLANALESTTQDETELTRLREYRMSIDYLNEQEAKLTELRSQIREISFAKGPRDTVRLKQLQEEATKTANRINVADKKLLRMEMYKKV